jgi:hypothetical protein
LQKDCLPRVILSGIQLFSLSTNWIPA